MVVQKWETDVSSYVISSQYMARIFTTHCGQSARKAATLKKFFQHTDQNHVLHLFQQENISLVLREKFDFFGLQLYARITAIEVSRSLLQMFASTSSMF
jgi:hypothetical protein